MKKFVSLVLMGSLAVSATTAFAAGEKVLGQNEIELLCEKNIIKGKEGGMCLEDKATKAEALALLLRANNAAKEEYKQIIGEVIEVDDEGIVIDSGEEKIKVNLFEAVVKGCEKEDIKVGDTASALISSVMTRSIPAMSNGIFVNISDMGAVSYFEVSEVEKTEEGYMIYDKNGEYVIAAGEDTKVSPFKTKNIMKMQDISKGDRLAVISETMTMSIPAVMNPSEIIVLEDCVSEESFGDTKEHWAREEIDYSLGMGYIKKLAEHFNPDSEEVTTDFVNEILKNMGLEVKFSEDLSSVTRGDIADICYDIITKK